VGVLQADETGAGKVIIVGMAVHLGLQQPGVGQVGDLPGMDVPTADATAS
jgi:hypothetical protein